MQTFRKYISSSLFGLTLICFFAPFLEVSCSKVKITNPTGWEFVTGRFEYSLDKDPMTANLLSEGGTIRGLEIINYLEERKHRTLYPASDIEDLKKAKPNILLLIAFCSAIAGLLGFLFKWNSKSLIFLSLIGLVSDILFGFILKNNISNYITKLMSEKNRFQLLSQMVSFDYTFFYYFSLIGFLATAIFNVYWLVVGSNSLVNNKLRKCPFCAEDIKNEAIVCRYCGKESEMPINTGSETAINSNRRSKWFWIKAYLDPIVVIAIISMIILYIPTIKDYLSDYTLFPQ